MSEPLLVCFWLNTLGAASKTNRDQTEWQRVTHEHIRSIYNEHASATDPKVKTKVRFLLNTHTAGCILNSSSVKIIYLSLHIFSKVLLNVTWAFKSMSIICRGIHNGFWHAVYWNHLSEMPKKRDISVGFFLNVKGDHFDKDESMYWYVSVYVGSLYICCLIRVESGFSTEDIFIWDDLIFNESFCHSQGRPV